MLGEGVMTAGKMDIQRRVNIHLTGCHHSCAQHYISDIGLIGAKVPIGIEDDTVEGYHLFAGGGFGPDADVGQEVLHADKAQDLPPPVAALPQARPQTPPSPLPPLPPSPP